MSDAIEELMAEIDASQAEGGADAPPTESAATAASGQQPAPESAATAPAEKPRYGLDDVILDDPRLPPSLRGQPASKVHEWALGLKAKHDDIGYKKNQAEAELRVAQSAMEVLRQFAPTQPQVPPPAKPTTVEVVRERLGDQKIAWEEPDKFAATAAELGAEIGEQRARAQLQPEIDGLKQRLDAMQKSDEDKTQGAWLKAVRSAYLEARPEEVTVEEWDSQPHRERLAAIILQEQLPEHDPASYRRADEILIEEAARRYARKQSPAPAPIPALTSAAPVLAPPVGGARTAPVAAAKATARIDSHTEQALNDMGKEFGFSPEVMQQIAEKAHSDPRYRRRFE